MSAHGGGGVPRELSRAAGWTDEGARFRHSPYLCDTMDVGHQCCVAAVGVCGEEGSTGQSHFGINS